MNVWQRVGAIAAIITIALVWAFHRSLLPLPFAMMIVVEALFLYVIAYLPAERIAIKILITIPVATAIMALIFAYHGNLSLWPTMALGILGAGALVLLLDPHLQRRNQ